MLTLAMGRSTLATCRSHKRALGCDSVMRISGNFTAKKVRCHDALVEASPAKRIHLLYGSANVTCPSRFIALRITLSAFRSPSATQKSGLSIPAASTLPKSPASLASNVGAHGRGEAKGGLAEEDDMNVRSRLTNRWLRLAIVLAFVLLGASCFLRYVGSAFAHSGTLGLSSRIRETQLAGRQAWFFLCMFISMELLCAAVVGLGREDPNLGSAGLRFAARYGSALALSLLATGVVAGLQVVLLR
jgi:hypothetical protein